MEFAKELPPPLEPLIDDTGANAPYPIEALPTVLKDAAKAISKHVQAPLELTAPIVLAAATSLAQGRVNAYSEDRESGQPCSLYFLTLAESGAGKSRCRSIAFKTMYATEKQKKQEYKQALTEFEQNNKTLTGEELKQFLADTPEPINPKVNYGDSSFEALVGALVRGTPIINWDSDEGGIVLCGHSLKGDNHKAILGGLTKLFDEGFAERTRGRGNAEGSGEAYDRRFSMFLSAQEVTVREAIQSPIMREQGLLPRFLLSNAPSWAGQRLKSLESLAAKPSDHPAIKNYWQRCEYLQDKPEAIDPLTNEVEPKVLQPTQDALGLWLDFYNNIETQLGKWGEYEDVKHFGSRTAQIATRLSTVLAFFEGKTEVDSESMASACAITKYSLDQWLSYTDYTPESSIKSESKELLDWMLQPEFGDKWHSFELRKLCSSKPCGIRKETTKRIKPRVNFLAESGYLLTADQKRYVISPQALNPVGSVGNVGSQQPQGLQVTAESRQVSANIQPFETADKCRQGADSHRSINSGLPTNPTVPTTSHASEQESGGFETCL